MVGRPNARDGDLASTQVAYRSYALRREQLIAASVYPTEHDHRLARFDSDERRQAERHVEISGARGDQFRCTDLPRIIVEILHVGKPFVAQQLFCNVCWRSAE